MDLGLSADKTVAARAEASWRTALKIPEDPPWTFCKQAAALAERPRVGIVRRPLIWPPPLHIPASPAKVEVAEQEAGGAEWRKRLEERAKDEISTRREGIVVYDDTMPYAGINGVRQRGGWAVIEESPLVFESRFESGNLRKATQVGPREYDLSLRPDKDSGHVQWYYFMVSNVKAGVPYVFSITNFVKQKSLYNQGLKPLLYSNTDASKKGLGWRRTGTKCAYYAKGGRHILTFTVEFPNDGDICYLAHCYPYTYTDMQLFLASLEADPKRQKTVERTELCRSLADNKVDLLTITEPGELPESAPPKGSILLTARVHPGETQASWSLQGCIEFLTSNADEARLLRQRYVIYVVPMLNPDGVINGHYRCSLAGQDLNRLWADPDLGRHPCIWHVKNLVRQLTQKGLVFFCDFHGHSTKKNAFMYGCDRAASAESCTLFPLTLSEISAAFSYVDCDFKIQKNKVTTGRVVVCREFGIANSYTLEVSFLGHKVGTSLLHFNLADLQQLGRHFGVALVKHHLPSGFALLTARTIEAAAGGDSTTEPDTPTQKPTSNEATSGPENPSVESVTSAIQEEHSSLIMHSPVEKVWQEFLESPERRKAIAADQGVAEAKYLPEDGETGHQSLPDSDGKSSSAITTGADTQRPSGSMSKQPTSVRSSEPVSEKTQASVEDNQTVNLEQPFDEGTESDSRKSSDKLDLESGTASTVCASENDSDRAQATEKEKEEAAVSEGDHSPTLDNAISGEDDCSSSDHESEGGEKSDEAPIAEADTSDRGSSRGASEKRDDGLETFPLSPSPDVGLRFERRRRSSVDVRELRETIMQAFVATGQIRPQHAPPTVNFDPSTRSPKWEGNHSLSRSRSSDHARRKKVDELEGLLKLTHLSDPHGIDDESGLPSGSPIAGRSASSEGGHHRRRDSLLGTENGRNSRLQLGRCLSVRHEKEAVSEQSLQYTTDVKSVLLKHGKNLAAMTNEEYVPINCAPSVRRLEPAAGGSGESQTTEPASVKASGQLPVRRSLRNKKDFSFPARPPPQTAGSLGNQRQMLRQEYGGNNKSLAVVSSNTASQNNYWWDNLSAGQRLDRSMRSEGYRAGGGGTQVTPTGLGSRRSPGMLSDKLSLPSILGNRESVDYSSLNGGDPLDSHSATSAAAKLMAISSQQARTSSRESVLANRRSRSLEKMGFESDTHESSTGRADIREGGNGSNFSVKRPEARTKFIRNVANFKQSSLLAGARRQQPNDNIALPKPTLIFD